MSELISEQMKRFYQAAGEWGFAAPCCHHCQAVHYPPQRWCPRCLSTDVGFKADDGHATVLSSIAVHRSFDPAWEARLPAYVSCAVTDSGFKVFAMAGAASPRGGRVRLQAVDGFVWVRDERAPASVSGAG